MKTLGILIFLLISRHSFAQTGNIQAEINDQVWKPFMQAFNDRNNKAYSELHSKDFIRVLRDNGEIYGFDKAFEVRPDSITQKWAVWRRNIELRFTERIASEDKGFEIGYYKTSSTNTSTGEKRLSYGKFHVLLRKEDGVWKILMDADGHEGVDESVFQSAEPIQWK